MLYVSHLFRTTKLDFDLVASGRIAIWWERFIMFGRFRTRARLQEARRQARKLRNIPSELDPPRFPHRAIKFVARFAIPFFGAENRANGSRWISPHRNSTPE
jgi:hypothetical protein